jgi:hypothetical protein
MNSSWSGMEEERQYNYIAQLSFWRGWETPDYLLSEAVDHVR